MSALRSAVRDILTEEFLRLVGQLPAVLQLPDEDLARVEWIRRKDRLTEAIEAASLRGVL